MLTNSYTCSHTNSQRPACSFMPVRTSALYQDDGRADGHQNRRLISVAKRIQETFSPHEWGIESAQSGKLSVKVGLIIKHSPWPVLLQEPSLFLSSRPTTQTGIKKRKPAFPAAVSRSPKSLMHASSRTGRKAQQGDLIRYTIAWHLIF